MIPARKQVTSLINGSATGAELHVPGYVLVGVTCPASISGTSMTFTGATASGGTFVTVKDPATTANTYTVTIASSLYIPLDARAFMGLRAIKPVSSATETSKTFTFHYVRA